QLEMPSTIVEKALQIGPFLTNKANFRNAEIAISSYITTKYNIFPAWRGVKTNPIQSQFKAKQSQFWTKNEGVKAKTNPIQTQFTKGQKCYTFDQKSPFLRG
ncbi:MAG: hypothetical protein GY774_17650, partial [Planctomycetes bacterium]|nr:hypothetical protein [Planctomycetota bacterium]